MMVTLLDPKIDRILGKLGRARTPDGVEKAVYQVFTTEWLTDDEIERVEKYSVQRLQELREKKMPR